MPPIEKWSLLALLRFGLAFIVAVNHLAEYTDVGWLAVVPRFGAFEAILGFLLISGYSIGASYAKSPHGFFIRRAKRIYPVYLAAIALTCIADPPKFGWSFAGTLVANLLFLNQAVTSTSLVGGAWSLSLEIWLYALAPWLKKCSDRTLLIVAGASFLAYVLHACGRTLFHWPYYAGLGWGLDLPILAYTWVLGCLLAWGKDQRRTLRIIGFVFAGHGLLTLGIQVAHRLKHHGLAEIPDDLADSAFRAGTLLVVWLAFRSISRHSGERLLPSPLLRFLGDISYPCYLTHLPVYIILARWKITGPWTMLTAAILVAALVYRLCDIYSVSRASETRTRESTGLPRQAES